MPAHFFFLGYFHANEKLLTTNAHVSVMSTLRDALTRVTRTVRHIQNQKPKALPVTTSRYPVSQYESSHPLPRDRVPQEQLKKLRPHLRGFQRKRFQQFLKPLDMPQLKIFDESESRYDAERAEANLQTKRSTDRVDIFNNFLSDRLLFNKVMEFLVELTPANLKSAETTNDPSALASTLAEQETVYQMSRYPDIPRFWFQELPPFPEPLTKESFREYVYFLTHLKILYKNSSSLSSGIVPEILLYTHFLENDQFKPYRSVDTYNYLIKFFGYDKFQSSFARELLLVMTKDGHRPNIDTINQLLNICRKHSNRRFLTSTYKVIMNYLTLAKRLDLEVNLSTWNRVYDCIDNIFLKELFVNKISSISLPVLNNLCIRLLEDFSKTTRSYEDVISFIETDLHRPSWRQDTRIAEKVVYHAILNSENDEALSKTWENIVPGIEIDGITLKNMVNAICANRNIKNKAYISLSIYARYKDRVNSVPPEVYGKIILTLCQNEENHDVIRVSELVRYLIHNEALHHLNLPMEMNSPFNDTEGGATNTSDEDLPFSIPKIKFSEHYRIMKRLTQSHLIDLEAQILFLNSSGLNAKAPWEVPSSNEICNWNIFKKSIKEDDHFLSDVAFKLRKMLGLEPSSNTVPARVINAYRKVSWIKMGISNDINLIQKLKKGFQKKAEEEMSKRGIFHVNN